MSRDGGDVREGISRRGFVKGALAMGATGVAIAGGGAALQTLAGEPSPDVQETFLYVNAEGARVPVWWVDRGLVGKRARFSHFRRGQGANMLWRWHVRDGKVTGGVSALLMCVDEKQLEFPVEYVQEEFVAAGLYAVFNCCTHACCRPGWQLVPRMEFRNNLGYNTIYCVCHCAQFHPTRIREYTHPGPPHGSGASYIGVANVAGPADRGMPLIPIAVQNDFVLGKMKNPDWYRYLDTMRNPLP
jgi:Rieske Fe-S protein